MTFDDYIAEVRNDLRYAIEQGDYDHCEDLDEIRDEAWTDDSVTGNGSGSYTFSTYKAKQNVAELIWDDDFLDEFRSMDGDVGKLIEEGAEAVDVTARCLALGLVGDDDLEDVWHDRLLHAHPDRFEFGVDYIGGKFVLSVMYELDDYDEREYDTIADLFWDYANDFWPFVKCNFEL